MIYNPIEIKLEVYDYMFIVQIGRSKRNAIQNVYIVKN